MKKMNRYNGAVKVIFPIWFVKKMGISNIMFDIPALTYATHNKAFDQMRIHFNKYLKKDSVITDATASIGSDSIKFSKVGKFVNSVEINPKVYQMLENNISKIGNIRSYNCDYTDCYNNIKQDIIYMDPPWGGKDYKKEKYVDLVMGKYQLHEFLPKIKKCAKYIFLKVPLNYNLNLLKDFKKEHYIIYKKNKPSFRIVIINLIK